LRANEKRAAQVAHWQLKVHAATELGGGGWHRQLSRPAVGVDGSEDETGAGGPTPSGAGGRCRGDQHWWPNTERAGGTTVSGERCRHVGGRVAAAASGGGRRRAGTV
jgi:hypothetical protein